MSPSNTTNLENKKSISPVSSTMLTSVGNEIHTSTSSLTRNDLNTKSKSKAKSVPMENKISSHELFKKKPDKLEECYGYDTKVTLKLETIPPLQPPGFQDYFEICANDEYEEKRAASITVAHKKSKGENLNKDEKIAAKPVIPIDSVQKKGDNPFVSLNNHDDVTNAADGSYVIYPGAIQVGGTNVESQHDIEHVSDDKGNEDQEDTHLLPVCAMVSDDLENERNELAEQLTRYSEMPLVEGEVPEDKQQDRKKMIRYCILALIVFGIAITVLGIKIEEHKEMVRDLTTTSPSTSPSNNPTVTHSALPTYNPSKSKSPSYTTNPSEFPTNTKSPSYTSNPSELPTFNPTKLPTYTINPSELPTYKPTKLPSYHPSTKFPTYNPSKLPTYKPSKSKLPTYNPSKLPTHNPSKSKLPSYTQWPTYNPSKSKFPTYTNNPSELPTYNPTELPTYYPSKFTTYNPSLLPTASKLPTMIPSESPTLNPTELPTYYPSELPTYNPTELPTFNPSELPTQNPSESPTKDVLLEISPWSNFVNSHDKTIKRYAKVNGKDAIFCGIYSIHSDNTEDRRFKFLECRPEDPETSKINNIWLSKTSLDAQWMRRCSGDSFITAIQSWHSNNREDRTYLFECAEFEGWKKGACVWSGNGDGDKWVNDYDHKINFTCGKNEAMNAVDSIHSNHHEDRKFAFECCRLSKQSRNS